MAATIVQLTEQEWEVLQSVLGRLEEGGIIIPPGVHHQIEEDKGFLPENIEAKYITYDFGGEADVLVDVVRTSDHMAVDAMKAAWEEEQPGMYRNYYECAKPGCGHKWTMDWDCTCDDKCPKCNTAMQPYESRDIDEAGNLLPGGDQDAGNGEDS